MVLYSPKNTSKAVNGDFNPVSVDMKDLQRLQAYNQRYVGADVRRSEGVLGKDTLVTTPLPDNIDFTRAKKTSFKDLYTRASYYFYNCSIFSTSVIRIAQESIRNGIEWEPLFMSKCPKCGEEYEKTVKKCTVCGYEGTMLDPDKKQQGLFINWEGGDLQEKVNRNGWSLDDLLYTFIQQTLIYNQPVILCKSVYVTDGRGSVKKEIPQEFVPLSPTKSRMIFDDTGTPGDGTGFCIFDRSRTVDLRTAKYDGDGMIDGLRYYPAHWQIFSSDGQGSMGEEGNYYNENEIYHVTYGVHSQNYGMPLCLLVETDMKGWIALETRTTCYYEVGHPQGVFVINNVTEDAVASVQQSIRLQMQGDPYSMPIIGTPASSDKATNTKWHQFADNPTTDMMAIKEELLQRITSIFGIIGLFAGDTSSLKGNTNEGHQIEVMDRALVQVRALGDGLLAWMCRKCGITDWVKKIKEPPDNQANDEADKLSKVLLNAKMFQELGFEIVSQADGEVEISSEPKKFNPLDALNNPDGVEGSDGNLQNFSVNDMLTQKDSLSKNKDKDGDSLMEATR